MINKYRIQTIAKHQADQKTEFMNDILLGLSQPNKQIQSKYFYDEIGSELFDQITRHPDYYLTACELEILAAHKKDISNLLNTDSFNLIEFGPGEGIKTQLLAEQFLADKLSFTYYAVDISEKYLRRISEKFNNFLPNLKLIPLNGDYLNGLKWLSLKSKKRNLVLFLGSSIGNFDSHTSQVFLTNIWNYLNDGDYLLIGFDLRKDVDILQRAYNDRDGITRKFNLNLLRRLNDELGANFNLDKFQHYPNYNVYSAAMESYLLSREEQEVNFQALNQSFFFKPYEAIHVEHSHKYLLPQIEEIAQVAGFEIEKNYLDSQRYFVDSLWRVCKTPWQFV